MGKTDKAGAVLLFVVVILALVFGIMRNDDEGEGSSADRNQVADNGDAKRAKKADLGALRKKAEQKRPRKRGDDKGPALGKGDPGGRLGGGKKPPEVKPGVTPGVKPSTEPKVVPKKDTAAAGAWPKKHEIVSGDVLGAICARYYGTTRMVTRVLEANPGLDPKRMGLGDEIVLPAPSEDVIAGRSPKGDRVQNVALRRPSFISSDYLRRYAGAAGGESAGRDLPGGAKTYTVRSGDVLSKIAQRELGSSKHVDRLIEANKDIIKNPNQLREGWVLVLPNVN